jgi:hypothetical protein
LRSGYLLAAVLAVLISGCGSDTFTPLSGWGDDLDVAREQAAQSGKPLAVLYTAPWSSESRKFMKGALVDATVTKELERFERVHVNFDEFKEEERGLKWVPALVLSSPQGEVRKLDQGNYPSDMLAAALGTLKAWHKLDGWEPDEEAALRASRRSGKPVAVLYSAAWNSEAVAYEGGALAEAHDALAKRFTLLRLNYAANKEKARSDGIRSEDQIPALVLPQGKDQKLVVPGRHSAELLTSFVGSLGGYRANVKGWSSDLGLVKDVRMRRKKGPMVVVLDKPDHWASHYFVHHVLGTGEVAEWLRGFEKVRVEFSRASELAKEFGLREHDAPWLLIFNRFGDDHKQLMGGESPAAIVNELRAVGGRLGVPAPKGEGG